MGDKEAYTIDELLIFLKVISKLRPNDRLIFDESSNQIQIQKSGWVQAMIRTWTGESRTNSIKAIKIILDQAICELNTTRDKDNLSFHLQRCINGLFSLIETYQTDQSCVCTIECYIDKIRVATRLDVGTTFSSKKNQN